MTKKQYKLLREIYEAEFRHQAITFNQDDTAMIKDFKKRYEADFLWLRDSFFVTGAIDYLCELNITDRGKQAMKAYEDELDKRGNQKITLIGAIAAIIAAIAAILGLFK